MTQVYLKKQGKVTYSHELQHGIGLAQLFKHEPATTTKAFDQAHVPKNPITTNPRRQK